MPFRRLPASELTRMIDFYAPYLNKSGNTGNDDIAVLMEEVQRCWQKYPDLAKEDEIKIPSLADEDQDPGDEMDPLVTNRKPRGKPKVE